MMRCSFSALTFSLAGSVFAAVPAHARSPASYQVVYSFQDGFTGGDGNYPVAGLREFRGTLYGTTELGGGFSGGGVVFSVTPAGVEKVLHAFQGADGFVPAAGLTPLKGTGTLYGTTELGGATGNGTVFSITPAGVETAIYSFQGGSDGAVPLAGLINLKGTLYGTTQFGGTGVGCPGGCGTVFSITPAGVEKVLYSFQNGNDGSQPFAGLIKVRGALFGTTQYGGGTGCGGGGCGTVFSVTPAGVEKVVYAFQGGSDGANPVAGLTNLYGALYGTTYSGGAFNDGTVFVVSQTGLEAVIHSFANGNDGANPAAGLINVGGTLYGTTFNGGAGGSNGTVFSVTTTGVETVLHGFAGLLGNDGSSPAAGLINVGGALYGTTYNGGIGNGTVFAILP